LKKSELADASNLYNSRLHKGLPPTPIAAPGRAAIAAAANPVDGDWLYFCTVNLDTGDTKFAATASEFEVIKAEYEKWLSGHPEYQ
ncbi:MAG: endolytic transglycosylase MltG, partial [Bifidobacteriaceae bacterium]|nr:endolytic transglycosylase MltG [Bifidobacteriaceae bacterium]